MLQTFFTVGLLLAPSLAGPLEEVRCQKVSSCIASSVIFIIRCETILYEYERIRISFKNIGNQLPVWWPKNYMNLNFTETRRLTQWWLSTKGGRREIILKQGKTLSNIQWNQLKDFQSGFKLSKVNFELETVCLRWKPCLRMWIKCDLLQMGVNGLCWHQCTRRQPTQRRLLEALPVHFRRKFWISRNSNDCPCHIQVKPKHHKCQCDQ